MNGYVSGVRPGVGESLALRWLRVVDAHPWRNSIGIALIAHGLRLALERRRD